MLNRIITEKVWEAPRDTSIIRRLLDGSFTQIIDVGARGGLHERWQPFSDLVTMVGFEPDAVECERLTALDKTGRTRFLPYALGAKRERRKFFRCKQARCSSLYPPNEGFASSFAPAISESMRQVGEGELDVVPLDDIARAEGLKPDCLKVDVQGAELDVLRGGASVLPGVKMFELEVEFNPQYLGQPLFFEIDGFARAQGFSLLGLRRTFWRRRAAVAHPGSVAGGQLVHGDVLYYNERLLEAASDDLRELMKWLLLLAAYRQHDFILQLLAEHPAAGKLAASDRKELADTLMARPRPIPRALAAALSALGPIEHHVLRQWVDASRPSPAEDWHDPDFF